jgi:hypothetical protein
MNSRSILINAAFQVFVVAVMSIICAIGIIWICCILKQRLGDFKCTDQKPSHQADTLQEQQVKCSYLVHVKGVVFNSRLTCTIKLLCLTPCVAIL